MSENAGNHSVRRVSRWRLAAWSTAAIMLLTPLVAMQFTDEVAWNLTDFAVFGAMLVVAGGVFELATRMTGNTAYRIALGVALATAFILVWVNGAVGIIGNEGNPANLMFGGVLAVGIISAVIGRFQPQGMALALVATAVAQVLVAIVILITESDFSMTGFGAVFGVTAVFVTLWLISAWLFRKSGQVNQGRNEV